MTNESNDKVLIYTTPTCVFCKNVKQYFDEKGIKYETIDVLADASKAQEMIDKSGQMGVPVTDYKGNIIIGFDKAKLDAVTA
ncbi:glutathione S-transferase N-terminal domain-containing protein [Candidatus Saccharibacteria bacterium]|nr:glutathione S-transferase N-terminal domain-containing protein [Candidatus Saccharibacteria bacterium]